MLKESSLVNDMIMLKIFFCVSIYIGMFLLSFYIFTKHDVNNGCNYNESSIIESGILALFWPIFFPIFIVYTQIPRLFIWLFNKINKDE